MTSPGMRSTSGSRPRISLAREPGDRRHKGVITLAYSRPTTSPGDRLFEVLESMLEPPRHGQHHLLPQHCVPQERDPGGRRRAPGRHLPLRHRPATSVLDVNCKAHELDNLYVVDTSFFPSIGAVNPALTAMANALRVGDHLLERMGVSRS